MKLMKSIENSKINRIIKIEGFAIVFLNNCDAMFEQYRDRTAAVIIDKDNNVVDIANYKGTDFLEEAQRIYDEFHIENFDFEIVWEQMIKLPLEVVFGWGSSMSLSHIISESIKETIDSYKLNRQCRKYYYLNSTLSKLFVDGFKSRQQMVQQIYRIFAERGGSAFCVSLELADELTQLIC